MKPTIPKSGPSPSDVKVTCTECGAVRWYNPSTAAGLKQPYRCQRCARKSEDFRKGPRPVKVKVKVSETGDRAMEAKPTLPPNEDLKHCPFCGGPGAHYHAFNTVMAACANEKCPAWTIIRCTPEQWNRRVIPTFVARKTLPPT